MKRGPLNLGRIAHDRASVANDPKADIDGSRSREQERKAFLLGLLRVSAEKQNEYEGQQERHGHERGNIVCR
jgi:hypothetical protein